MKKSISVILFIILLIVLNYGCLELVNSYYDKKVKSSYCDSAGDLVDTDKNQGKILQEISADMKDNLMIFGSSELSTGFIPQYPANFFKDKKDGFQVNLIGRGHYQDFVHAMDFLAIADHLKNKKAVFVLSPQWFDASGLTPDDFNMNFSEVQFYSIMFNKNIDKTTKLKVASRVNKLLNGTKEYSLDKTYSYLYSKNDFLSNCAVALMNPYYKYKYKLYEIKDKMNACKYLKKFKESKKVITPQNIKIDWKNELKAADNNGKTNCTDNDLGIYNEYYDKYVKPNLEKMKNSNVSASYLKSQEYDDLKFLLESAKKLNMKILFINVPVNGRWYDYTGFPKSDRQQYYSKVKSIVTSYGFQMEDYSGSEYEKYFLCDVMHLGWKGWVRIDEAMDKFYHQN